MAKAAQAKPKPSPAAKPDDAEELYSISKLAEYYDLDRATMKRRLTDAGVLPALDEPRRKLYRLSEVEAALETDTGLDEIKLRKLTAEAQLKELELQREQEQLLPRKEVEDYTQKLFTAMFQRLGIRLPREIAPQLWKAESQAQMTKQLETSIKAVFNELRADHRRFLSSDSAGDPRK